MADSNERRLMIAMDGSAFADYAFNCKYEFHLHLSSLSAYSVWFVILTTIQDGGLE